MQWQFPKSRFQVPIWTMRKTTSHTSCKFYSSSKNLSLSGCSRPSQKYNSLRNRFLFPSGWRRNQSETIGLMRLSTTCRCRSLTPASIRTWWWLMPSTLRRIAIVTFWPLNIPVSPSSRALLSSRVMIALAFKNRNLTQCTIRTSMQTSSM